MIRLSGALTVLMLATSGLQAQIAGGVYTSNGSDNNPNQTPAGNNDVISNNGLYLQDTIHSGKTVIVPSYDLRYSSFATHAYQNYLTHTFTLDWSHPSLFMSSSRAKAIAAHIAADSAVERDTIEDIADSAKDALVENLIMIGDAAENGGFGDDDTVTIQDTNKASGLHPVKPTHPINQTDSSDLSDASDDTDTTSTVSSAAHSVTPKDSLPSTAAVDSLQAKFGRQFAEIADSLDENNGSDSIKRWVEFRVRAVVRSMVDSFPGDSSAIIIRDSVERFIARLQKYVPPIPHTALTVAEVEDSTIYAPLSLPRESLHDWSQSDLTLETSDDDTARYSLELEAQYELRSDFTTADSLGAHIGSLTATAHQASSATFNIYEQLALSNTKYALFDTLNNTQTFGSVQARWQPTPRFTGMAEIGFGVKRYSTQQVDTQKVIQNKKIVDVVVKSATSATQFLLGIGGFWRVWRQTSVGATFFLLNNPSNNARISANTYLVRRHGAFDLSDDRFTYSGLDSRLYFKQQLFSSVELGLTFAANGKNYNQYAFQDVVKVTKLGTINTLVRTKNLRQDSYRMGEMQITKTWFLEHFVFSEISAEFLLGYIGNASNDPNFIFHDGYATVNLSVAL